MSHRHPRRPTHKTPRLERRFLKPAFWMACGLWTVSALAQTVYRCGNDYSTTPMCSDASAPEVHDPRSEGQHQAQDRLTQQTQAQAERLERNRLKAEKQSPRSSTAVTALPAKDLSLMQDSSDSSMSGSPTPHAHPKKTSPFFTAKDGQPKSKKTATTNAKPKANADTPAKP